MKRYSIQGATSEQVKNAGGSDIKEAPRLGLIFANLDESSIAYLESQGCRVKEIKNIKATQVTAPVTPPAPIPGAVGYTPVELIAAIGFSEEWRNIVQPPLYGEGFAVAIIDSGIRESHELVKGRVVYSQNFTQSPMRDGFDHGTGVASIVAALAPKCDILNLKVLDDEGAGTDEAVALGIDAVIELKETRPDIFPYVINLSLGEEDEGDASDPVRVACRAALDHGIFVLAAAGNAGPELGTIMSPACERYVGAVGSASYNPADPQYPFLVSQFSSRGPTREGLLKPDALLPGEQIKMASAQSDTATAVKSGTSFACPFGSGVIVISGEGALKQALTWPGYLSVVGSPTWVAPTPHDILDYWLPRICLKPAIVPGGKDPEYGWGIPFGDVLATRGLVLSPTAALGEMLTPLLTLGLVGMLTSSLMQAGRAR